MFVTWRRCAKFPNLLKHVVCVGSKHTPGVTFGQDLSVSAHVDNIIEACSGSLHTLGILREQELPSTALHLLAEATRLVVLLYAVPAWCGMASAAYLSKLDRFHAKTQCLGYLLHGKATIEYHV